MVTKILNRTFEIDRIPENNRGLHYIEFNGSVALAFKTSVTDFTQAIEVG